MKLSLWILTCGIFISQTVFGQGTILWDESVNGPLSESGSKPTQLGLLNLGTNTILAATEIEPIGGGNWLVHGDVFSFTVPGNSSLSGIFLTVDKPNVSSWIGDPTFSTQIGYAANSLNGELILQWQFSGIGPGTYGMYMENHDQESFTSIANFRLDFFLQPVPEPGAFSLLFIGAGLVGLRCWRKIHSS